MKTIVADKPLPFADHAFGTKEDSHGDIDTNLRMMTERLGPIAHMRQVHSPRIQYASRSGVYEECDALYTDRTDFWLAVKTADCVPILMSCPQAVAAVHAGWRGLSENIVPNTIQTLIDEFNIDPIDIHMHIGPCIQQEHYEVEDTIAAIFPEECAEESEKKGHKYLNLPEVVKFQAKKLGVPNMNIHDSKMCTYENSDQFFSYRRRKTKNPHNPDEVQLSLVKLQRAEYGLAGF